MIESHQHELFEEPRRSVLPMVLAGAAALLITALVFAGYTLLRKRHAEDSRALALAGAPPVEARQPPKALIILDEAMLKAGNSIIGGSVKNTSNENLENVAVELELRRRKDATTETQLIPLSPNRLEPQQETRFSIQVRAQDYSSAKLVGLKAGAQPAAVPFMTAQGQKRPPEKLETKTVIIGGKPGTKGGEFLNSPDNPARVP